MMPSRSNDTLLQLIHSLQKGEKRNFKLYITRNSGNEDLKAIQLFDALDKMNEYDENVLLKKLSSLKKDQLANRKAHLYRQILASLRLLESNDNIDIELHEQLDYARILYNKGLYLQSLKILDRTKENARQHHQLSFLMQVLFLEKKIESLHITRSLQDRAKQLSTEANEAVQSIAIVSQLSNLALELYGWYINHGHARNVADETSLTEFFSKQLPAHAYLLKGFYERLYLYQSYCWFAFIRQDFLMYYRYTQKWVDLFDREPIMVGIETAHYIKGFHNLLNAHFDTRNFRKFDQTLVLFKRFSESETVLHNDNNRIQVFVYLYIAKINQHFMQGTFTKGLDLVPVIEEKLHQYALFLDRHRVLVFYYKIASLYFGSGDYGNTITYLNKIINWKVDLRNDLQGYARLLQLIAHYELGNFDLLEYLIKSVYRYMAKVKHLNEVEVAIFRFLRHSFNLTPKELKPAFNQLLSELVLLENNRFATRAFAYLDIISWLQSKLSGLNVQDIIARKYKEQLSRKTS